MPHIKAVLCHASKQFHKYLISQPHLIFNARPMKTFMFLAIAAAQAVAAASSSIVVESFDKPKHHWEAQNDPGLEPLSYRYMYTLEHTSGF